MLIYHDAEVSSDGGARGRDVLIRLELNAGLLDRKAL